MIYVTTTQIEPMTQTAPLNSQAVTIGGTNIVSVGIQTNNWQTDFYVEQCFVSESGTEAFVQVYNGNTFQNVGWWCWVVTVEDDSAGANRSKPTFTVGEPQLVKNE